MECDICVNNFNKSDKKRIDCPSCQIKCCLTCCKKYLLDSKEFPNCMACKNQWSRLFLTNNFPKVWLNTTYKTHRENLIEERHDAMLHNYQPHIVSYNRMNEYNEKIAELIIEKKKINTRINVLTNRLHNENYFFTGATAVQPEPNEILDRRDNKEDLEQIERDAKISREKMLLQRGPCPKEGCLGYICDEWECGVCYTKICQSCMLVKEDKKDKDGVEIKHECKEEDVESTKQIRKDSRNCPNCRVRIFRTEGCNQMWCTMCKTFFRWDNLEIIRSKNVHNPHYAEYVQKNLAAANENTDYNAHNAQSAQNPGCPRTLHLANIMYAQEKLRINKYYIFREYATHAMRKAGEIADEVRMFSYTDSVDRLYRELGVDYLLNRITKGYRKTELQKKIKEFDKRQDTINVRELWSTQITAILYDHFINKVTMIESFEKIKNLENYCKDSLQDIGKWYNSTAPAIRLYSTSEYDNLYKEVDIYINNETTFTDSVDYSVYRKRRGYR